MPARKGPAGPLCKDYTRTPCPAKPQKAQWGLPLLRSHATLQSVLETLPLHHLTRVVSLLARGEIVAYPTGTTYGLGVNALDRRALERLSALKGRPDDMTYTVLLPEREPERFVAWSRDERLVFERLQPRPLTLLVAAREPLAHLAKDGRVGIRTADHPFTRALAELIPFPITATSANPSGAPAACAPGDLDALATNVRLYVVEGGRLPECLSSTVAAREGSRWKLMRKGEVTAKELSVAP